MDSMNFFTDLCRLCLKQNHDEVPIFQENKTENTDLYDKISVCLPVKVSETDELPKKICFTCSKSVDFIYNFWQLSSDSEKQLQDMLNNVKETKSDFLFQNSDMESNQENTVVLYDTLTVKDVLIDCKDLEEDISDCNIEIQEVDVSEFTTNGDYVEEDVDTVTVNTNVPSSEVTVNDLISIPADLNTTGDEHTTEETQISQIVESSNVSLRTFEEQDSLRLKLWDLTLSDFFLIPYDCQAEEKFIQPNTVVLMDVRKPESALPDIGPKSYVCSVCSTSFEEMLAFLKHYENEHNLFKCPFCEKHFKRRYVLESHLVVHSSRKDFACPMCKMKFKRRSDVRQHVKRIHWCAADIQIFGCDQCSYRTKHKRLIRIHVLGHLGISLYSCDLCGSDFKSKADLMVHRNNHLGIKPFQCDVCGNHFTRKHYMLTHRRLLHEELYSYQCDVCGRTFSYKTSLVSHMKLHTGENRIQCDLCNKIVSSKVSLTNHKKIHFDAKEFVCGICDKVYMNKYSLQEHVLVHTGSKPFQCLQCDKSFSTRKKLLNHEQIHEEVRSKFSCSQCDKSYLSKFKLKEHVQKHHTLNWDIGILC